MANTIGFFAIAVLSRKYAHAGLSRLFASRNYEGWERRTGKESDCGDLFGAAWLGSIAYT
jgi:hypothetical protein